MNVDLNELYQETIIEHAKKPRNFRVIEAAMCMAEGHNPLCGDSVAVYATVEDGAVTDVSFQGSGCAIMTASASLMTQEAVGKTVQQFRTLFERFRAVLVEGDPIDLGALAPLRGVGQYPMRVKCATLPWHALQSALTGVNVE